MLTHERSGLDAADPGIDGEVVGRLGNSREDAGGFGGDPVREWLAALG